MLVVDELKKNDPHLRLVALMLAGGLFILFAGLWWVQVVKAHEYQNHREAQAYRTVRLPAVRGKILDREGRVLADNRARYNLCLYFDDLNDDFKKEYERIRPVKISVSGPPFWKFWSNTKTIQTNRIRLKQNEIDALALQARCNVATRVVAELGKELGEPLTLDLKKFKRSYDEARAMPFILSQDLDETQIAKFQEKYTGGLGAQIVLQPVREYPCGTTAAHLLGYVQSSDESIAGEESFFDYRLADYKGVLGLEGGFDSQLHGHAGVESVLVNNLGYRQAETIIEPPELGKNVVTTIDLDLQRAAEAAVVAHQGENPRAAVVVMDVRNGDVLAMVSTPEINPNYFTGELPPDETQKISRMMADENLSLEINRATQGGRHPLIPGSIFKPIVGLAALENGLNPKEKYHVEPNPRNPAHGHIKVGARIIDDPAGIPGDYDLRRAIVRSSNSYFIYIGLRTGIEKVVRLGEKFHFGEGEKLPTLQNGTGHFPTLERIHKSDWRDGDSANIFFGQGEVNVTPLQIACAYSAIANGGTVLWPRLVERIEPQDSTGGEVATNFPAAVVRDRLGVSQRSLQILREAMLSETEDAEGSGKAAVVGPQMRICGKTGTAQIQNEQGVVFSHNYWFASFAPYESPRYAVVIMVQSENGGSGGIVCAPIAHDIYEAILKKENAPKTLAKN